MGSFAIVPNGCASINVSLLRRIAAVNHQLGTSDISIHRMLLQAAKLEWRSFGA
jgi:hypothetical protein